ncbi:hypothetical protein [Streptomyces sp. H39-C1]|uniref:hypothetical protein n=1 Tax=Streptomyces sp. H39-C1 TaxID=3004355 RepID=UPI0022AE7232|nr:hypothetical protein [Streptomyces sp. H39-C1]MCZ4099831.1 hypothetical protein [Streptomyces sp. H39-C1]
MTTQQAEPQQPPHPGLTLGVYRVDEDGNRTSVQPARPVPAGLVPITGQWPLCVCKRCRAGDPVR